MESNFRLLQQSRVDDLTRLLIQTLDEIGAKLVPKGGARAIVREVNNKPAQPMDFGNYDISSGHQIIGSYQYELKPSENKYDISLNLIHPEHYETLARILAPRFPEIKFPVYTG